MLVLINNWFVDNPQAIGKENIHMFFDEDFSNNEESMDESSDEGSEEGSEEEMGSEDDDSSEEADTM